MPVSLCAAAGLRRLILQPRCQPFRLTTSTIIGRLGPLRQCKPLPLRFSGFSTGRIDTPPAVSGSTIKYEGDTPLLTLTLSDGSQTAFRLSPDKPISQLLDQVREENPAAIQHIAVYEIPEEGGGSNVRLARSMPMDHILQGATRRGGFVLEIDDRKLKITYPTYEERAAPVLRELASVEEHLLPLEKSKAELDKTAHRHSTRIAWLGLAALCAQWGIMARLTWWEYSWDVMEPISYFLTTGAGILGYMFYVATSKDYTYETLAALTVTKTQARLYRRAKLDLRRYMELRQQADKLRRKIDAIKQEYHVQ